MKDVYSLEETLPAQFISVRAAGPIAHVPTRASSF